MHCSTTDSSPNSTHCTCTAAEHTPAQTLHTAHALQQNTLQPKLYKLHMHCSRTHSSPNSTNCTYTAAEHTPARTLHTAHALQQNTLQPKLYTLHMHCSRTHSSRNSTNCTYTAAEHTPAQTLHTAHAVGCLMSQQQASVSQGRICSDNYMCCHTETEVADQTFYLTQSQYTDTGPTSPSADPIMPGAWQGSHWSANF